MNEEFAYLINESEIQEIVDCLIIPDARKVEALVEKIRTRKTQPVPESDPCNGCGGRVESAGRFCCPEQLTCIPWYQWRIHEILEQEKRREAST